MKEFTYTADGPIVTLFNLARAIRQRGLPCGTKGLRAFAEAGAYSLLNNGTAIHAEDATPLGQEYIAKQHPVPEQGHLFPATKQTASITIETIYGNVASILLPEIREMCWYNTGYAIIWTSYCSYHCRMKREDFNRINEMRRAD